MECKYLQRLTQHRRNKVLIETYWNVNSDPGLKYYSVDAVLIETYWNVNKQFEQLSENRVESINRNILECKSVWSPVFSDRSLVLIETYWNVNSRYRSHTVGITCVLIETYWNVNFGGRELLSDVRLY